MTDSRPPPPKRPPERDFTQKIRYCKGCHNEIHRDVPRCLVCGTPNVATGNYPAMAPPEPPASPAAPSPPEPPEPTKK